MQRNKKQILFPYLFPAKDGNANLSQPIITTTTTTSAGKRETHFLMMRMRIL